MTINNRFALTAAARIYLCDVGHEIKIPDRCTATFSFEQEGKKWDYNFCFRCWGEWAFKQWPLKEPTTPQP